MLTGMRFSCALFALSACYAPSVSGGAPCDLARDNCPMGQTCQAVGSGSFCMADGSPKVDAGADAIASDGGTCLGGKLLGSICLSPPPASPVSFTTATINTASVGGGNCSEIRAQTGGPSLCIIVGTTITVPAGITVRATGPNPLVLIATQSITVNGGLDVSSRAGEVAVGAGARTAVDCAAVGIDGLPGRLVNNTNYYGGGGGAGGSFGGLGGAGGAGGRGNIGPGTPCDRENPRRARRWLRRRSRWGWHRRRWWCVRW
jgi:hypothetical protein